MSRPKIDDETAALSELGPCAKPPWLAGQALPFGTLSDDEFEVLCFLLLRKENPTSKVYYFGKTGDGGRDIVIVSPSGTITVIQCKRFAETFGIGHARRELAKLYLNVESKAIPVAPDLIEFFVASDLSSNAQDLIVNRKAFDAALLEGAKEVLKTAPPASFAAFVGSWTPQLSHVSGEVLSERIKKFPDLIERFFSTQKVVTGDAADIIKAMEANKNELLLAMRPLLPANQTEELQRVVKQMEADNPGLAFSAVTTTSTTMFTVSPKPGAAPVDVGHLEFPSTEAGARGRSKFRSLIEEGRAATLEEDECTWTSLIKDGGHLTPERKRLHLQYTLPAKEVPVLLETFDIAETATIEFTSLRLTRMGTKQLEFNVSGGYWPGDITFTIKTEGGGDVQIHTLFEGRVLDDIRRALRFLLSIARGAAIRVRVLPTRAPLFELFGLTAPLQADQLEASLALCDDVAFINERLNVAAHYPKENDGVTGPTIRLVAAGIRHGVVGETLEDVALTVPLSREHLDGLLEIWATAKADINSVPEPFVVDGVTLPVGPVTMTLQGTMPLMPLEDLRATVDAMGPNELLSVELAADRIVHAFEAWVKKAEETASKDGGQ